MKKARKNLSGLYLKKPNGITTGSSGIGVAAAAKSARKAQRLTFDAATSSLFLRFSQVTTNEKTNQVMNKLR